MTTVTPDSRLNLLSASSTSDFRADVDAARRLGNEEELRLKRKALARQIFCWLPPESSAPSAWSRCT